MKFRFTSFLVTLSVAGTLALLPRAANADGVNQFRTVPVGPVGAASGSLDVNSFSFTFGDPLQRLFANVTFNNGVTATSEQWLATVIPMATGTQLTLTRTGIGVAAATTITFTNGVSAPQNALVNAINFDVSRPDRNNIREWYLWTIMRRLYP
jgi:hypothetical protein